MITDYFAYVTDALLADFEAVQKNPQRGALAKALHDRLLRPFLPPSARVGTGVVIDHKERTAGPFDWVISGDSWPPFGQGESTAWLVDGVFFCLSARDWSSSDLSLFAQASSAVHGFETKEKRKIPCIAFSYGSLPIKEIEEFLKSASGEAVDAVFVLGKMLVVRNRLGWYGDPEKIPFLTERSGPAALKALAFYMMQCIHAAQGQDFPLADYQHL